MNRTKSTALGLAYLGSLGLCAAATAVAPAIRAQAVRVPCPAGGFDVCFPNLDAGAPSPACISPRVAARVSAADATDIAACLGRVCRDKLTEPEPGFFSYCCAQGGSIRYDDFCVLVVQSECSAVADHCVDRCPPLDLLLGTVTLAPPPPACIDDYPAFVASVCTTDPFCCDTSWDGICAEEALTRSLAQ